MITEQYSGSNATGSSGASNRVLTLSNNRMTIDDGLLTIVSGLVLHSSDFTISHKSSSSAITFLNPLFNDQPIIVSYQVAGLVAGTAGEGVGILDQRSISKEIEFFGTSITLRTVTDSSYSKYGDATESTLDYTKTAFVQILRQEDEIVKEGIFQAGDKIFWFKGDETSISRGNRIYHNSLWYEIEETIEHDASGVTFVIEARTRKV